MIIITTPPSKRNPGWWLANAPEHNKRKRDAEQLWHFWLYVSTCLALSIDRFFCVSFSVGSFVHVALLVEGFLVVVVELLFCLTCHVVKLEYVGLVFSLAWKMLRPKRWERYCEPLLFAYHSFQNDYITQKILRQLFFLCNVIWLHNKIPSELILLCNCLCNSGSVSGSGKCLCQPSTKAYPRGNPYGLCWRILGARVFFPVSGGSSFGGILVGIPHLEGAIWRVTWHFFPIWGAIWGNLGGNMAGLPPIWG